MAIEIVEYDACWPQRFEEAARCVRDALPTIALRIDHIGSTAVPGLTAKPVIDIQVSVAEGTPEAAYCAPLVAIGYTYAKLPFPYFHRPAGWPHTHHLHVRVAGSDDERRTLAFRDWLRTHPIDCAAYTDLKRRLAASADAETAAGRFRYSEGKTGFVRRIERTACLVAPPSPPISGR